MADGSGLNSPTACEVVRLWPQAEPQAFRDGMARLASGVAIVACETPAGPRGLLVTSLTGLSTEPPRLLFCVRKAAASHAALIAAEAVSVSLLNAADREEAERFCTPERAAERFDPARWSFEPAAPPELRSALAAFVGPVRCRIDAGTHTIIILDVSSARVDEADPLVYFARRFETLA